MELLSAAQYNIMFGHMGVVFTEANKAELLEQVTGEKYTFVSPEADMPALHRDTGPNPFDTHSACSSPRPLSGDELPGDVSGNEEEQDPYESISSLEEAEREYAYPASLNENRGHVIGAFAKLFVMWQDTENEYMTQALKGLVRNELSWVIKIPGSTQSKDLFDWAKNPIDDDANLELGYNFIRENAYTVVRRCMLALELNKTQARVQTKGGATKEILFQPHEIFQVIRELDHWLDPLTQDDYQEIMEYIFQLCQDLAQALDDKHEFAIKVKEMEAQRNEATGSVDEDDLFDYSKVVALGEHLPGPIEADKSYIAALPCPLLHLCKLDFSQDETPELDQLWERLIGQNHQFRAEDENTPFIYTLATALRFLSPKELFDAHEDGKVHTHNDFLIVLRDHCPDQKAIFDDLIARVALARNPDDELDAVTVEKWGAAVRRFDPGSNIVRTAALLLILDALPAAVEAVKGEHRVEPHSVERIWDILLVLNAYSDEFLQLPTTHSSSYDILLDGLTEALLHGYKNHKSHTVRTHFEAYCKTFDFEAAFKISQKTENFAEALTEVHEQLEIFRDTYLPMQSMVRESSTESGSHGSPSLARKSMAHGGGHVRTPLSIAFEKINPDLQREAVSVEGFYKQLHVDGHGQINMDRKGRLATAADAEGLAKFVLQHSDKVMKSSLCKKALHGFFDQKAQEELTTAQARFEEYKRKYPKEESA